MIKQILEYARTKPTEEICGLIVDINGIETFVPCTNVSIDKSDEFSIDPTDWIKCEELGTIKKVVHSHPFTRAVPSDPADLVGIEDSGLPWIIVNPNTGGYSETLPTGKIPDLIGRVFKFGYQDCYSIVRDYYRINLGITLPNVKRETSYQEYGGSYYIDNYEKAGFIKVTNLQKHDVIVMSILATANHAGVYLGDGTMLHH